MQIKLSVDISNAVRALHEFEAKTDDAIMLTLDQCGDELVEAAKRDVPVRTGRLRDSIRKISRTPTSITVGSHLNYSRAIEEGTGKMPARPYLGPNARIIADTLPEKFASNMR